MSTSRRPGTLELEATNPKHSQHSILSACQLARFLEEPVGWRLTSLRVELQNFVAAWQRRNHAFTRNSQTSSDDRKLNGFFQSRAASQGECQPCIKRISSTRRIRNCNLDCRNVQRG